MDKATAERVHVAEEGEALLFALVPVSDRTKEVMSTPARGASVDEDAASSSDAEWVSDEESQQPPLGCAPPLTTHPTFTACAYAMASPQVPADDHYLPRQEIAAQGQGGETDSTEGERTAGLSA
jgi:hypothetical protein